MRKNFLFGTKGYNCYNGRDVSRLRTRAWPRRPWHLALMVGRIWFMRTAALLAAVAALTLVGGISYWSLSGPSDGPASGSDVLPSLSCSECLPTCPSSISEECPATACPSEAKACCPSSGK